MGERQAEMRDPTTTKSAGCSSSRAAEDTAPRAGEREAGVVDYEGVVTRVVCAESGVYELDEATCLLTRCSVYLLCWY